MNAPNARQRAGAAVTGLCGTASSDSSPEEYASGYQKKLLPLPNLGKGDDTDRGRALAVYRSTGVRPGYRRYRRYLP